jgi:hypothetical protein
MLLKRQLRGEAPSLDLLDAEGGVLDGVGESKLSVGTRQIAVELGSRHGTDRTGGVPCGFCNRVIGDERLMCLSCGERFHADKMCTGIDESVIVVLLSDVKGAVGYVCWLCRGEKCEKEQSGGRWGGAFEQLLKVVGSLVGEMQGMMMLMNEKR